jgi:hypothetical protein
MIAISQMRDCEDFEDDALEMLYCLSTPHQSDNEAGNINDNASSNRGDVRDSDNEAETELTPEQELGN